MRWRSLLHSFRHDRKLVDKVSELARERFAPRAERYDSEASFPFENYQDLREAGLLGLTVPAEYGGTRMLTP